MGRNLEHAWSVGAPSLAVVADDDPPMRGLVSAALRSVGFEVLEAQDGGELLAYVAGPARERLALIVTDVKMPHGSGPDVVRVLRGFDRQTPVIMMTAYGSPGLDDEAHALGATIFHKPFDLDDFLTVVVHVVGNQPRSGA